MKYQIGDYIRYSTYSNYKEYIGRITNIYDPEFWGGSDITILDIYFPETGNSLSMPDYEVDFIASKDNYYLAKLLR